jgi:hypothetical protein
MEKASESVASLPYVVARFHLPPASGAHLRAEFGLIQQ